MNERFDDRQPTFDNNRRALVSQIGEPVLVVNKEMCDTLVQYGTLEMYDDENMDLSGTIYHPDSVVRVEIPDQDTIIAGKQAVYAYVDQLLIDFQHETNLRHGILAATIIDQFADDEMIEHSAQLFNEITAAIMSSDAVDSIVAECVLEAPSALRAPILAEVKKRLLALKTLHHIQKDPFVMAFVRSLSEREGVSEYHALRMIESE